VIPDSADDVSFDTIVLLAMNEKFPP